MTQINFDKNGNTASVEYCASGDKAFKKIQQITSGMTAVLAKPPKDCEAVMELIKKAQYSIAERKTSHTVSQHQQKPKEKIKLEEKSSEALWDKAASDNFKDRIQVALDEQAGNDIMQYLAKDDNSHVRQAVARTITETAFVALLAKDESEIVRAEIAKRGLQSDVLVKDPSALVWSALASSGL